MALTIKSSALTGRIVPFFISSCSDRSSRLIANRKLGNKVLRQISFPHSLVRISLYINKGSSGLAILFNRIVSKRKCIRNHWKQQTDEIKKSAFCSYEMFFSRKANLFLGGRLRLFFLLCSISIGFGVNSKGCGDNSKGYGDNSKAYGDRNRTAGKP